MKPMDIATARGAEHKLAALRVLISETTGHAALRRLVDTLRAREGSMKATDIVRKPITSIVCGKSGCKGTLWRLSLSRLEEGLGHEGFCCEKCGRTVKYVPPYAPGRRVG